MWFSMCIYVIVATRVQFHPLNCRSHIDMSDAIMSLLDNCKNTKIPSESQSSVNFNLIIYIRW